MLRTMDKPQHIRISVNELESLLMFDYDPQTPDALFDLCDERGRILKTGDVVGPVTKVKLADVHGGKLILMVLDGESSTISPVNWRMAG